MTFLNSELRQYLKEMYNEGKIIDEKQFNESKKLISNSSLEKKLLKINY